jgi:two-component system alkaline phosphatase synthesis response regulator PhoP
MVRGERVDLTPIEFKLLLLLTEWVAKTCHNDEIRRRVWGSPHYSSEVVRWHISGYRGKIETDTDRPPRRNVTVRGVGYRYKVPEASTTEMGSA